jgi:hypothetical protein
MEELSTPEMLSLRGGADSATVISAGNIAIALPIDIAVGIAFGSGSEVTQNSILNAEAVAGNIIASIAQMHN